MVKPSDVLSKTTCRPVEDSMDYANEDGSQVCAVSAFLVEKGYQVIESTHDLVVKDPKGKIMKPLPIITHLVDKIYKFESGTAVKIITAFHDSRSGKADKPSFKRTAKILREQGL